MNFNQMPIHLNFLFAKTTKQIKKTKTQVLHDCARCFDTNATLLTSQSAVRQ